MRVIIERDPGPNGQAIAEQVKAAAQHIAGCEVAIVDRAVPQALITERPDVAYAQEVEAAKRG